MTYIRLLNLIPPLACMSREFLAVSHVVPVVNQMTGIVGLILKKVKCMNSN